MSKKKTYKEVQEIFAKEGYYLLSKEYKNNKIKIKTLCPKKHICWININNFISNCARCVECQGNRQLTYDEVKNIFKEEGYALLSSVYKNTLTKVNVMCPIGHKFSVNVNNFKNNKSRCPECAGLKRLTVEQVRKVFEKDGLTLISKKYINNRTKLEILCQNNHRWAVRFDDYSQDKAHCPKCNLSNVNENKCRSIFELLFNEKFPSVWHDFIINPRTSRKLQLDGYCDKLKLAFEYDGEYHYKQSHNGKRLLSDQKYRDDLKTTACESLGITLIRIPYTVKKHKEKFIKEELTKRGIVWLNQ